MLHCVFVCESVRVRVRVCVAQCGVITGLLQHSIQEAVYQSVLLTANRSFSCTPGCGSTQQLHNSLSEFFKGLKKVYLINPFKHLVCTGHIFFIALIKRFLPLCV